MEVNEVITVNRNLNLTWDKLNNLRIGNELIWVKLKNKITL